MSAQLAARLRRLRPAHQMLPANDAHDAALAELMARVARLRGRAREIARMRPRLDIAALGGRWIDEHLLCVERRYTPACRHGDMSLRRLLQLRHDRSGLLGVRQALDPRRIVFLDTETNGLSGGAGTLAFMIGMARLEGELLVTRQYVITRYGAEGAMLDRLARDLADAVHLVSYNGKRFDVPLLQTRLQLHGRDDAFAALEHIDLLHALRRARRHRPDLAFVSDCRLQTAEARLLRLERRDDLPGQEVPRAWEQLLRDGDANLMRRALEHNRLDVLSLGALLALFAESAGHLLGCAAAD